MASERLEMNGDADGETEASFRSMRNTLTGTYMSCFLFPYFGVPPQGGRYRQRHINMNHYANKKSAVESMLDVALLMANAAQLKAVLEQGPGFTFYVPLIALLSISLSLQIIVGIMLIFIVKWNLNDQSMHYRLTILENITTALVFLIVVINVFITAFGVQGPVSKG